MSTADHTQIDGQIEDQPPLIETDPQTIVQIDNQPQAMSTDPQTEVFVTVELFEAILINVDWQTLLRVQSVSHHWRDIITTSHPIRRALGCLPLRNIEYLLCA